MRGILNGIALSGGTRPYGGTFLAFSDGMPAFSAVGRVDDSPVTYLGTHRPPTPVSARTVRTHQPVQHLWALRAIPGP